VNNRQKKQLRAIGHTLKPCVTVSGNGLSENLIAEINRAFEDHELIKIRVAGNREVYRHVAEVIRGFEETDIVQSIGRILLVYRPAREANPALSNILRSHIVRRRKR